ncbi:sensor histidine kinase [Nocardia otitidiscaviarum]|uniref:histidine kinase n=1 Tax=Nocardia otitidiscaviarum TaxID=1823 RepID=A0A516NHA3_9NOCA|nr:histidine kinase [Nocardia otitidiscaviarum]MCP9623529.1 histidine kinase [Nocardia otitidiscaviarum]QDP78284.1 sensor histidine kinase [Nocardia otitidiscaviarum]
MKSGAVPRTTLLRRAAAGAVGLLLGALTVPLDLAAVAAAPFSERPVRAVTAVEGRRLTVWYAAALEGSPAGRRAAAFLAVRSLLGLLAAVITVLICAGLVVSAGITLGAATGGAVPMFDAPEPGRVTWTTVAVLAAPGLILGFLAAQGLVGVVGLEVRAWRLFARPGAGALEQRVVQLAATRAEVIDAIDEERRRIERDIHDGVQQRVVALSILLGRAERETDPAGQADLRRRALAETGNILADLREVSWRIYPAMLARDGLRSALEALADRTPVPTRIDYRPTGRAPRPVESACYFAASEAVTNVIKHAAADRIDITVTAADGLLRMSVRDNGRGGADPNGHGLSGIASRVTALDGTLSVDSPVGGPTIIRVEVPCA